MSKHRKAVHRVRVAKIDETTVDGRRLSGTGLELPHTVPITERTYSDSGHNESTELAGVATHPEITDDGWITYMVPERYYEGTLHISLDRFDIDSHNGVNVISGGRVLEVYYHDGGFEWCL